MALALKNTGLSESVSKGRITWRAREGAGGKVCQGDVHFDTLLQNEFR